MSTRITINDDKIAKVVFEIFKLSASDSSFFISDTDIQIKELAEKCEKILRILMGKKFDFDPDLRKYIFDLVSIYISVEKF